MRGGRFLNNDVTLNKALTIERCIMRIKVVYDNESTNLNDFTKQDSIILNIQRFFEACIDLAMHIVAEKKLGIPQSSRDSFDLLNQHKIISEPIAKKMKAMVGFRNIAVHDYQAVNIEIVKSIIEFHLNDFLEYTNEILKA